MGIIMLNVKVMNMFNNKRYMGKMTKKELETYLSDVLDKFNKAEKENEELKEQLQEIKSKTDYKLTESINELIDKRVKELVTNNLSVIYDHYRQCNEMYWGKEEFY